MSTIKVKISYTVEVDCDDWETNYGVSGAAEIREDVKAYIRSLINDDMFGVRIVS